MSGQTGLQPPKPGSLGGTAVGVTPSGELVYLNTDADGNLAVSTSPPAPVTATPFVAFGVNQMLVATGAATLLSVSCSNVNGATRYLQVFDQTVVLAGEEVPVLEFFVVSEAQSLVGEDFLNSFPFTVGITLGVSTTSGSYTAATAADHNLQGTFSS